MIDFHKNIIKSLEQILPVYYEMTLTKECKVPCISYCELNNSIDKQGDSIDYSYITYQIKVWANNIETIQKNTVKVDKTMKALGFKRIGSGELYDRNSTLIQKILTYQALALEN